MLLFSLVSIIDYIVKRTLCRGIICADANRNGVVDILDLVWII